MQLTMAEKLLYATVKLTATFPNGMVKTGTGFFVNFTLDNESTFPAIVTNKHVVAGSQRLTAVCHIAEGNKPSGKFVPCHIEHDTHAVVHHPNADIDLCAIAFAGILNQADAMKQPIFFVNLALDLIPTVDACDHFDAIEEVTMVGCPNGLSDQANNLPIARRGITATALGKRYNGKPEFMVDMACFPGSSGSPIYLFDRTGYYDRPSNQYRMGQSRLRLVGVLYAGPLITNTGQIVLGAPQFSVATMMHLGNAVRATEINVLHDEIKRVIAAEQSTALSATQPAATIEATSAS